MTAKEKVREKVKAFIDKNCAKEHDKMMDGMKHDLYAWEEIRDEFESRHAKDAEADELALDYSRAMEYLKQAGLKGDFETWRRGKK